MSVYYLEEHKIDIRIIDNTNVILDIKNSRILSPKTLKATIFSLKNCVMNIIPTLPNVFFYFESCGSHTYTYQLPYRTFLGFASQLSIPEEKSDWKIYGF